MVSSMTMTAAMRPCQCSSGAGPASRLFYSAFAQWTQLSPRCSSQHHHHYHHQHQHHRRTVALPYRQRRAQRSSSFFFHTSPPSSSSSSSSSSSPSPLSSSQTASDAHDGQASLAEHTRRLLRRVPHSVVVVTTSTTSSSSSLYPPTPSSTTTRSSAAGKDNQADWENGFRAMTVSSLTSVTLHPTPIISFNVKTPSSTYSAIRANDGQFLVHFLAGSAAGARIANTFTHGSANSAELFKSLTLPTLAAPGESGGKIHNGLKVFSGRDIARGAPLIVGDGVMRVLRCRLLPENTGALRVGDHMVVLAQVQGLLGPAAAAAAATEPAAQNVDKTVPDLGLCYVERAYHAVQAEKPLVVPTLVSHAHGPLESAQAVQQEKSTEEEEEEIVKTMGLNLRRGDELTATK